jgi:hypothetical protein
VGTIGQRCLSLSLSLSLSRFREQVATFGRSCPAREWASFAVGTVPYTRGVRVVVYVPVVRPSRMRARTSGLAGGCSLAGSSSARSWDKSRGPRPVGTLRVTLAREAYSPRGNTGVTRLLTIVPKLRDAGMLALSFGKCPLPLADFHQERQRINYVNYARGETDINILDDRLIN